MKRYYYGYNNGVSAIVGEATLASIRKHNDIWQLFADREKEVEYKERWRAEVASEATRNLTTPIFTFVRRERFVESPWFTGDTELMHALVAEIKERGDIIQEAGFYVPFSNGCEVGIHGKSSMRSELGYVTSENQFEQVFGISINSLVTKRSVQTAV